MGDSRKRSPICSQLNSRGDVNGSDSMFPGSNLGEKRRGVGGILEDDEEALEDDDGHLWDDPSGLKEDILELGVRDRTDSNGKASDVTGLVPRCATLAFLGVLLGRRATFLWVAVAS